jgi:hypothetical protein
LRAIRKADPTNENRRKTKINKAVEEERDRQTSRYTTANRDAVNEAEKRFNEIV